MRIFLTGATGVIGRRVIPLLLKSGHHVTAVGRTPEKCAALARLGAAPIQVDMLEPGVAQQSIKDHDTIINLATHMPSSTFRMMLPGSWKENDRVRKIGSTLLVDAALCDGVNRFIQESFAPIYVDGSAQWIDENWPVKPVAYNRTILDAETSAERFTKNGGTGIVVRFAAFYGPDAFHIMDMAKMIQKGWSPLPGSPEAYISSISHDDAATAVVAALNLPSGIYNVTDNEPLTRREYVDSLAACLDVPPPKFLPKWLVSLGGSTTELMSRSLRISNQKLRRATHWVPKYPSVREGWQGMIQELKALKAA
jgi:nucleoside-diphosphate-sugar epimerase